MATVYKVLGQSNPSANTLTTLYTVPSATNTVCSTLTVCNLGASTTYRVAVRPSGNAIANSHYVVYDSAISSSDSVFLTLGVSLQATDVVSVYAATGNVAFNLYGSEIA